MSSWKRLRTRTSRTCESSTPAEFRESGTSLTSPLISGLSSGLRGLRISKANVSQREYFADKRRSTSGEASPPARKELLGNNPRWRRTEDAQTQFLFEIVFCWRWSWSPPPWQLASQTASWWPWQGDQSLWFRRKQPEFGLKSCFFRESENSEDVSLKKQVVAGIILLMNSFLVWSFLRDSEIFYLRCIV